MNEIPLVSFGAAIDAAKAGKRVARVRWNGAFVFQRPQDTLDARVVIESVRSIPQSVKDSIAARLRNNEVGKEIVFHSYLCMFQEDSSIMNGWVASPDDVLSDDWVILDY